MPRSSSFLDTLSYFKDRRLLTIFFFGIASGFPWVMIGSAMSGWLKDEGLSRTSIGLFGLIFIAYSINWLWSPLVDRLNIFKLSRFIGHRKSWIICTQAIIVFAAIELSQLQAHDQLNLMALFGLFIAIAGATQDIAIDAYRIDILTGKDNNLMAAGSAMATSGWWTGYAGLGSIPFLLADTPNWQWPEVYLVLAAIMALLMVIALVVTEPKNYRARNQQKIEQRYLYALPYFGYRPLFILFILPLIIAIVVYANIDYPAWPDHIIAKKYQLFFSSFTIVLLLTLFSLQLGKINKHIKTHHSHQSPMTNQSIKITTVHRLTAWLLTTMVAPIHEFFQRNGTRLALSILLFIFLFKLGEAYLGRMSIVFYREIGFSNADIAYYSKMLNWAVTIVFSLIGSVFTIRYGILKGLFIGGIAMASSNLLFALMAMVGPNKALFAMTVLVDGFTSAWGSVAFVALLSVLCNRTFTASQYALMASLGTFARVMLGSYSGMVVDWLEGNWSLFFILTALMVLPSLLFLYSIRKPLTRLINQQEQCNIN
jgi:PAT family beta-lactamase induction signal transducer AmpG